MITPKLLILELTRGCNLSCPMCRSEKIFSHGNTMSDNIFEESLKKIIPFSKKVEFRGWGESLLLKNFEKYVDATDGFDFKKKITTNLSINNKPRLTYLFNKNFEVVASIDSIDQDTLNIIRPGANAKLIKENLKLLSALYGNANKINRLSVHIVLQDKMLDSLDELFDFITSCGIEKVSLAEASSKRGFLEEVIDIKKRRQVFRSISKIANKSSIKISTLTQIRGTSFSKEKPIEICDRLLGVVYLSYDGWLGYCDHLIGANAGVRLKHINEVNDIFDFFSSSELTNTRERHYAFLRGVNSNLNERCRWCYTYRH